MDGSSAVSQSSSIPIDFGRNAKTSYSKSTDFTLRNTPDLLSVGNVLSQPISNISNRISRSIGLDSYIENERKSATLSSKPATNGKAEGYFSDTWESIKGDWRELKRDFHKTNSYLKQQSIKSTLFQQVGNGVDFVMDVVGSVVSNDQTKAWGNEAIDNLTKTHAYQASRHALAEMTGETLHAVDNYLEQHPELKQTLLNSANKGIKATQSLIEEAKKIAKNHPELMRNLKAGGEIIQIAGVGKAAQLGVRGGSKAAKVSWNVAKHIKVKVKPRVLSRSGDNLEIKLKQLIEKKVDGAGTIKPISTDYINDSVGRLGGKLYSPKKLSQLNKYLEKRGVQLKVGDKYLPYGKAGGFNAEKGILFLKNNPTNYEVWHELSHFRHFQKIGKVEYLKLPRSKNFNAPEQFVFDMLENSSKRWNVLNFKEQQHAIKYIEYIGGFR